VRPVWRRSTAAPAVRSGRSCSSGGVRKSLSTGITEERQWEGALTGNGGAAASPRDSGAEGPFNGRRR
jgi:hypothetical protein